MKKLVILFLFLVSFNVLADRASERAQRGLDILDHDISIFQNMKNELNMCNQSISRMMQSKCLANMYEGNSRNILEPLMAERFRAMSFLYSEAALIDDLGDSKKIKNEIRNQKYNEIQNKLQEVIESYNILISQSRKNEREAIIADRELEASEASQKRNNEMLRWSLGILGNTLSSQVTNTLPTNQTYIINNRVINCVRSGNTINCF